MLFRNRENHYGLIAITFHWLIALLIIGMLAIGLYMTDLPISTEKLKLYGWHKEFGILVLILVTLRLGWLFGNTTPGFPDSIPRFQQFLARLVHWAFYGFMFAMPITGWLMTSAAGLPPSFFGLFTLPPLVAPDPYLRELFDNIHQWLAYGLIVTICGHVGAALKHHFIDKDDIFRRMLP